MSRHAFWTIIVGEQATAFRAPLREDLQPTLVQLQRKHPDAVIRWFEKGQLWETPGDAQDAAKAKRDAERPRRGPSWRPGGDHKDPRDKYKVPRDVKRKRWASQAAEGRGPWVKGGREDGRTRGREDGRTGGPEDRRAGGREEGRGAGEKDQHRERRPAARQDGRRPAGSQGGKMAGRDDGRKTGQRPHAGGARAKPGGPKAGGVLDRRSAVVGGRRPRQADVPIPGRTPAARDTGRSDAPPRPPKNDLPPARPGRDKKVFKAGEKPPAPRKRSDDE